ncbi:MAG: DnaB helicase C-terminal domain-containing protein [Gemmatimonadaceae bacterium]|jgi:replicative DNA helicase|nr:DnaB helicase C-terminal domain-containing protein [Gemmatimonadaceae bacterium]
MDLLPPFDANAAADDSADDGIIPVGFPSLTPLLHGGLRGGDLVVLGGDTQAGTTSLALALALRASAMGASTVVLSGESTPARLFERALAAVSRVPLDALRRGELGDLMRAAVTDAAAHLRDHAPVMQRLDGEGVQALERAVDTVPAPRLLVVDGLESLVTEPQGRDDQLAWAVLAAKRLALRHDVAILLVTHFAAFDRRRPDLRPRLDDFGARGAIATHADLVLGLFREELYQRDLALAGAAELHLLKHRTGDTGYVDLYFEAPCLRFEDVVED